MPFENALLKRKKLEHPCVSAIILHETSKLRPVAPWLTPSTTYWRGHRENMNGRGYRG